MQRTWRMRGALGLLLAGSVLAGCSHEPAALEQILARGTLNVVTLNSPTTYYQGAHGPQGAEFQLATAFAANLGVELHLYTVTDVAALRAELLAGRADVVAAGITPDRAWNSAGHASQSYQQVEQLVVTQRGNPHIRNIGALAGKRLVIRRDSPQQQILEDLRSRGAPYLKWQALAHADGEPLAYVDTGRADYAIVDANEFAYAQHLYPGVEVALTLPDARNAHWIVGRRARDLLGRLNAFFDELRDDNSLEPLLAAATPESPDFELTTSQRLQRDIAEQLPPLRPYFEEAAQASGVDWRLLAAVAYVESKWQRLAASGDGAQGVMMLTGETATSLGVTDRSDPRQNILAGARYFQQVREQLPERISEPDRTWFAVAAYNMGYGHLEDARRLAQSRGKDPNSWTDVRESLPLLAIPQYYLSARHGYARGWEPVHTVDHVQLFLKLLEWQGETLAPSQETSSGAGKDHVPLRLPDQGRGAQQPGPARAPG